MNSDEPRADERPSLDDILSSDDERSFEREKTKEQLEREVISLRRSLSSVSEKLAEATAERDALRSEIQMEQFLQSMTSRYSTRVYWFMACYCMFAGAILIFDGFNFAIPNLWISRRFDVETSVMEILVGSTAVSVVGLTGLVVKGLFDGVRRK